jgi:hypothetical protein
LAGVVRGTEGPASGTGTVSRRSPPLRRPVILTRHIFHLPLLGDAKQSQVRAFGKDVFTG